MQTQTRRAFLDAVAKGAAGVWLAAGPLSGSGQARTRGSQEADREPASSGGPASGPLRVCQDNPRYFEDAEGRAVLLTGAHTWNNLVDMGPEDPPRPFDFDAYLQWLSRLGHNFVRGWRWELFRWDVRQMRGRLRKDVVHNVAPHPWPRTGPGLATDGKPRFDLTRFDERFFQRIRSRVEAAGRRGIYVSVMLFEGWGLQFAPDGWRSHPFHPENNVNHLGLPADGRGLEIHELKYSQVTELQLRYVDKMVDTLNDLDNVLFEISNENHPASTEWQYFVIRHIKKREQSKPKQHPVGMTFQYKGGSNQTLFDSPADWISPNHEGGYRDDPPPADGKKVVLSDTDHLWGVGGNQAWVWKTFTRGHNPLFMDPYHGRVLDGEADARWEPIRRSLGYALRYARRVHLNQMRPRPDLASTRFCLAWPGRQYLVYVPSSQPVTVHGLGDHKKPSRLTVEWFDPNTGRTKHATAVATSGRVQLTPPFAADCLLYLYG